MAGRRPADPQRTRLSLRHRLCSRRGRQPDLPGHGRAQDGARIDRATIQARQRKKLFLQGRPVFPLPTHYSQTWQHLPDYGAYHATLIADPALPGKWQPGEEVVYLLVFEGQREMPLEATGYQDAHEATVRGAANTDFRHLGLSSLGRQVVERS